LTKLEDVKSEISSIIPQLEAMENKNLFEPSIKLYRGKEGYLITLNDSLNGYSYEVLHIGSAKNENSFISTDYINNRYIPARVKKRITVRQLVFLDEIAVSQQNTDLKQLRKTKILPKECKFNGNIMIYQDKVAYYTTKNELITVLIESKEIAEMERQKFNLLWNKI